jgi:hypothetical protein
MKFDVLKKRLAALEPAEDCPFCRAVAGLNDSELDQMIVSLVNGEAVTVGLSAKFPDGLPDPSPTCSHCRAVAAMSDEEPDVELARLMEIAKASDRANEERARKDAQTHCDKCGSDLNGWWCYGRNMQKLCKNCA